MDLSQYMVAFDLDKTLLNSQGEISSATQATLKKLQRKGIHLVPASGRPLPGLNPIVDQLNLSQTDTPLICLNGALVTTSKTHQVIAQDTFDVRAIDDIMELYAKLKVPFDLISVHDVYSLNDFGISDYPKFAGWSLNFHHVPVANLQLEVPIYKVAIANQPKIIDHLARQIHSDLFRVTRSRRELLELMPSGVSKATGIIAASQFYDLPLANVIAFGDEENDLEMLKTAGIGVAMGNAVQAVRQAVTRHTLTNDQDGLTEFLEAYFK